MDSAFGLKENTNTNDAYNYLLCKRLHASYIIFTVTFFPSFTLAVCNLILKNSPSLQAQVPYKRLIRMVNEHEGKPLFTEKKKKLFIANKIENNNRDPFCFLYILFLNNFFIVTFMTLLSVSGSKDLFFFFFRTSGEKCLHPTKARQGKKEKS